MFKAIKTSAWSMETLGGEEQPLIVVDIHIHRILYKKHCKLCDLIAGASFTVSLVWGGS